MDCDTSILSQSSDTTDHFVAVLLISDKGSDSLAVIGQTDVVRDNLNPIWNYNMVRPTFVLLLIT